MPNQNHEIQFQQGPISQEALQAFIEPTVQSDLALGGISKAILYPENPDGIAAWAESVPVNEDGSRDYAPDFLVTSRGETPADVPEPESNPEPAPEPEPSPAPTPEPEPFKSAEKTRDDMERALYIERMREAQKEAARVDAEVFRMYDPEQHPSILMGNVQQAQKSISDALRVKPDGTKVRDVYYNDQLRKNSAKFVESLLDPEVQARAGEVTLTQSGLEMIAHTLKHGEAPDLKTLMGLRTIMDAQPFKEIIPTVSDGKGGVREAPELFASRPRYTAEWKLGGDTKTVTYGPYEVGSDEDIVAEVLQLTDIESWYLDEDQVNDFKDVMALENLDVPSYQYEPILQRNYVERSRAKWQSIASKPFRFTRNKSGMSMGGIRPKPTPGQKTPFMAEKVSWRDRRNESHWHTMDGAVTTKPSLEKTQAEPVTYESALSSWWQSRDARMNGPKNQIKDVRVMQKEHRKYLQGLIDLSDAVEYVLIEQDLDDEKTQSRIESFVNVETPQRKQMAEMTYLFLERTGLEYRVQQEENAARIAQQAQEMHAAVASGESPLSHNDVDTQIQETTRQAEEKAYADFKERLKNR